MPSTVSSPQAATAAANSIRAGGDFVVGASTLEALTFTELPALQAAFHGLNVIWSAAIQAGTSAVDEIATSIETIDAAFSAIDAAHAESIPD